ncbi:hypothetical protein EMIT0111MI5_10939 [Burkholderia sp. IT-111MI5]
MNYQKAVLGALQDANTALQRYGHRRRYAHHGANIGRAFPLADGRTLSRGRRVDDRPARYATRSAIRAAERDCRASRTDRGLRVAAEEPRARTAGGRGLTMPARYMHDRGIIRRAITHCAHNTIRFFRNDRARPAPTPRLSKTYPISISQSSDDLF